MILGHIDLESFFRVLKQYEIPVDSASLNSLKLYLGEEGVFALSNPDNWSES